MMHKLFIRKFRGEIPKNGGQTPRHFDEVMSLVRDGDTFRISMTQVLLVPSFKTGCQVPQWGMLLDDSSDEQKSFPVLVQELFSTQDNHLMFDREMTESRILDEVVKKFPKTFR
jgi:hypothetical protein